MNTLIGADPNEFGLQKFWCWKSLTIPTERRIIAERYLDRSTIAERSVSGTDRTPSTSLLSCDTCNNWQILNLSTDQVGQSFRCGNQVGPVAHKVDDLNSFSEASRDKISTEFWSVGTYFQLADLNWLNSRIFLTQFLMNCRGWPCGFEIQKWIILLSLHKKISRRMPRGSKVAGIVSAINVT